MKDAKNLSSTDAAIDFVGSNILDLKDVALRFFINACNKSGEIALYFDGFDEISPDAEAAIPSLLLTLERTKICRIYVSSRPNYVHVLEKTMLQHSMQFLGLTDAEKECALEGFWMQLLIKEERKVDESVLRNTAQKIIQLFQKEGHSLYDILAIPLQIRMLATIYYESLKEGQVSELHTVNLSEIFENFICLHAIRFYVDKTKMQWNDMKDEIKCRLIEKALKGAEEVACQIVIPELIEYNEAKMCDVLSSLFDELGLITNKNPPIFLHRTIAEYLAAKYVLKKMKKFNEEEILCRILTEERFNIVRIFINSLLVGKSTDNFCKKERCQWVGNRNGNNPLHVASSEGNVEIMSFLLRCDQTLLNKKNFNGQTAVYNACKNSKIDAVKQLLTNSECAVNIGDNFNNTPLHAATESGSTDIIEILLQRDKSLLNKQNILGSAPIHRAIEMRNEAGAKFLLENPDCLVNLCDSRGNTVLHKATSYHSPEIIEMILRRDKSVLNNQNDRGEAPLHCALTMGNEAAAQFLLENPDCLVNLCDGDGNTVLHFAAYYHSPEIIKMILRRDKSLINTQNQRGEAPLHCACEVGNEAAVKFLLENPDSLVNLCNRDGNTVLHRAARFCSPKIIEMILRRETSLLNKQNQRGEAPLHCACEVGNEAAAKFFLENPDCLVNLCDSDGNTVLHRGKHPHVSETIQVTLGLRKSSINKQNKLGQRALLHRSFEMRKETVVNKLLGHTYSITNLCDSDRRFLFFGFTHYHSPEIIEMVLQRDKSLLNKQNICGETPLHRAFQMRFEAGTKFLLENPDCLLNLCDSEGNTVLHIAVRYNHPKIIEMILRHDKSLLNRQNKLGTAPMHIAFRYNNSSVLNNLLSHSESVVDICDIAGNTVLHFSKLIIYSKNNNYCDEIKIILQHKNAPINKQNIDGETPLHNMIQIGKTEEAKLLLAQIDCSVNICDTSNQTVLHYAVLRDNFKLVKIILQRENVLINQQNCKGKTPLHLASNYFKKTFYDELLKLKPSLETVKLLIAYPGCSINMRDNNGLTALDIAKEVKQQEIIEILLQHGAEYGNRTVEEDNTHSEQSVTKDDGGI